MLVKGASPIGREALFAQIAKLTSSELLKGSESLCRLLRYLAEQANEHPGESVKEYQIATEVFGRPADFDPRLDSTVRVQTGRLRSKLAEYYAGEGAADSTVIEIPKGSYTMTVHHRVAPATETVPLIARQDRSDDFEQNRRQRSRLTGAILGLALLSAALTTALILVTLRTNPKAAAAPAAPQALQTFWKSFIDGPEQPWVVFSNAVFSGRPETGMRYFDSARDDGKSILDHYTGVGEVLAIHELDRLFTLLHHGIRVKRGRLLSLDDVKNNDVIFLGSPAENLTLRDIPTTQEFVFQRSANSPRKGDLAIANLRPRAGEALEYFGSATTPISEDYGLIGLMPGMTATHSVMILAGTTTLGTQAAAEFVCRPNHVAALLQRAGRSGNGDVSPFEAVIRVRVSGGVPVSSEIVALHTR